MGLAHARVISPPVDHLDGGRCGRCEMRHRSRGQSGPVRIERRPGEPLRGVCLWLTRSEARQLKDALNDLLPEQLARSPLTVGRGQWHEQEKVRAIGHTHWGGLCLCHRQAADRPVTTGRYPSRAGRPRGHWAGDRYRRGPFEGQSHKGQRLDHNARMRRPRKRLPHAGHVHVDVPWPGQRAGRSDVLDNAGRRGGSAAERPSQLRHALPGGWAPTQRSVLVADDGRCQESLRPESDQSVQRERPVGAGAERGWVR